MCVCCVVCACVFERQRDENLGLQLLAAHAKRRFVLGSESVSLATYRGIEAQESLTFVVLVNNVVLKVAACSRRPNITLEKALQIVEKAVSRTR